MDSTHLPIPRLHQENFSFAVAARTFTPRVLYTEDTCPLQQAVHTPGTLRYSRLPHPPLLSPLSQRLHSQLSFASIGSASSAAEVRQRSPPLESDRHVASLRSCLATLGARLWLVVPLLLPLAGSGADRGNRRPIGDRGFAVRLFCCDLLAIVVSS